ncbi:MAG TPA: prolyl oligopeptidase family serine peptidase [Blastocatellia bacterium]|nr:prolyl oligopeptidase family serine peptidase [Blastocatellia bacterium]
MMISKVAQRFCFSAALVIACCAVGLAQDSGQVLRVSVGYGTMKNTPAVMAKLTPEARAEVDRLGGMARAANGDARYGDALKHLYHAMALMRGTEWTPARALGSALTVKLDRAMVDPGDKVAIRIGQMFGLDQKLSAKLSASISLLKLRGDETVKDLKVLDSLDPDFIAHPPSAEVVLPDVEAGNYRIAVRVQIAGGEPIVKYATIHIESGLAADFAAAKARAAKIQESLKAKHRDALVAAVPSAEFRISLFELARAGEINFDRIDFRVALREATSMLDALDAGNDPFAARHGEFKKAYRSKVDSTLQPYQVFVPAAYDKSKAFPLVIALHGMGGDENSYFQAYASGAFKLEADKHGYIVACPKGRKPASMYIGDAERDVMDVIAEMRRDYNIDPDRIYLTGHSMGGYGTWSVAMSHPDVFAALAPVSGGANNPAGMSKIAHIPQLVVHGDNDPTVPVERSRVMVATGKKLGAEIKYIEVPGGDHGSVVAPTFKEVFGWFDAHRRKTAEAKAAGAGSKRN